MVFIMKKSVLQAKAGLAAKRKSRALVRTTRLTTASSPIERLGFQIPATPSPILEAEVSAKEVKRLKAIIAKLTATPKDEKPKRLYFDEVHLAERWGVSVKHIRALRYRGEGPKVTYFGRSVRYRLRDIAMFERRSAFASRSDMEVQTKAREEKKATLKKKRKGQKKG